MTSFGLPFHVTAEDAKLLMAGEDWVIIVQAGGKTRLVKTHLAPLTRAMILGSEPLRKHEVTPSSEIYVNPNSIANKGSSIN